MSYNNRIKVKDSQLLYCLNPSFGKKSCQYQNYQIFVLKAKRRDSVCPQDCVDRQSVKDSCLGETSGEMSEEESVYSCRMQIVNRT